MAILINRVETLYNKLIDLHNRKTKVTVIYLTAHETLNQYFGYDSFRDGQENLINDILNGNDTLGIMPTGAGKSMCFQIPALMLSGVTVVVSPLISLMKDQVNALTQSGIPAAFINSSLTESQISKALHNASRGAYKLIYIAPERLLTRDFMDFAQFSEISMLTVDEAHCISQWGQDFRPSYAAIPEFINKLQTRPVVSAFTATATPQVKDDIVLRLALNNPTILVSGFDRTNLFFDVKRPKDKFSALDSFLMGRKNLSGIVYCSTRNAVEEVCDKLKQNGYSASRYHAGLADSERHSNQDDFLHDRVQIMVATNAFGMGIDKSNVSFVVHYNMPMNIEGYYQEAGRAGRDGEPADCLLLYSRRDVATNLWMIENTQDIKYADQETEDALKQRNIKRLYEMDSYCTTSDCLRGYILKYFGESPLEDCKNSGAGCANCEMDLETVNITIDAQKIISCIVRMKERFGLTMVLDVLRGKKNAKVTSFNLDKLSTFGISTKSVGQLREIAEYLILAGYLHKTTEKFPIIKLGPRAKEALSKDASITMKTGHNISEDSTTRTKKAVMLRPVDATLLAKLKELRLIVAKEQNLPAFVIFHDSTLTDMCMKLPVTLEDFKAVSGVGGVKAERYGDRFITLISEYMTTNDITSNALPSTTPQDNKNNPAADAFKEFDASAIETTQESVSVSFIADKINCVLLECGQKKISGQRINDWLVSKGCLTVIQKGTKSYKVPTLEGMKLGITDEERVIRGESVRVNLFNQPAQEYIAVNTQEIVKFSN